jgi:hypothetical protein
VGFTTKSIRGIVTPCEWDINEQVKSVILATENEEEYLVDNSGLGKKLLNLIRQSVLVTGNVKEDKKFGKIITIECFEVLKPTKMNLWDK